MLQKRYGTHTVSQLALGASVLVILVISLGLAVIADECGNLPDLWFPPPGTLVNGEPSVQLVSALEVCQGDTVVVTVTVHNLTCGDAGPFDVSLYYDQFDNAHLIETKHLNDGLKACEHIVLEFSWNTMNVAPGDHTLLASADSKKQVDEMNEGNNTYTFPSEVTVRPIAPFIEAQKTYLDVNGGVVMPGDIITYEITITNTGCQKQGNYEGHEFTDSIPQFVTYVPGSASASSGVVDFDENQVVWDGEIPIGKATTISFDVKIDANTPNKTTICNQGHVNWDSNSTGKNDADEPTDYPATSVDDDPTCLEVLRPLPLMVGFAMKVQS